MLLYDFHDKNHLPFRKFGPFMMEDRWKMSSSLTVSSKLSTTNTILSKSSLTSKLTTQDKFLDQKPMVGLKRQQLSFEDSANKSVKSTLEIRPGLQLNTQRLQNNTSSRIDTMKNPLSVNKIQDAGKGLLGKPLNTSTLLSSALTTSNNSLVSATKSLKTPGLSAKSASSRLTMKTSDLKRFLSTDEEKEEPKKAKTTAFPLYPNLVDSLSKEDDSQSVFRHENGKERERGSYIREIKEKLIQFVSVASGGLAGELKKKDSETRQKLDTMVEDITEWDPEFILKVKFILSI